MYYVYYDSRRYWHNCLLGYLCIGPLYHFMAVPQPADCDCAGSGIAAGGFPDRYYYGGSFGIYLYGDFRNRRTDSRRCAFCNSSIRILYDIDGGGCGNRACNRIANRNRYGIGQQYVYVSLVGNGALLGEIGGVRKTE